MLIACLTGGLASGKSVVAAEFARLGCVVVEADALGHEVLLPGGAAYAPVIELFGEGILNGAGAIDRSHLASIVFNDAAALQKLSAIVHPAVRALSAERLRGGAHDIGIYAAAILVETGSYKDFAKLIVTACAREKQIERALMRPGATIAGVLARMERQWPLERKTEVADYAIDTGGTFEETLRQTKMVYEELRRLTP